MKRTIVVALLTMVLALLPASAMAQALTCTQTPTNGGGFRLECKPAAATATRTPTPTRTPTKVPTPTATQIPPTATATRMPPTATALPATAVPPTPTLVPTLPPMPVTGALVNVPLTQALPGDPALNYNNYSVVWLGKVVDSTYTDVRLLGAADGLRVRLQFIDSQPTAQDAITLKIGDWTRTVRYSDAGTAARGSDADGYRGWDATLTVPWSDLGGRPADGTVLPMRIERGGYTWAGDIHWGLPEYQVAAAGDVRTITAPVVTDSMVGGGTDCGAPDFPMYFPSWGTRNWGSSPYLLTQNQGDIADWPCFAKIALAWNQAALPAGAQVVSATLVLRHFGDPGYGSGYDPDGSGETVHQVYELPATWDEMTVGWDTLPAVGENVSRGVIKPVPDSCIVNDRRYCDPPLVETLDVTALAQRAGQGRASAAIYTAAGQYHSGKQLWSRESAWPPEVRIAYVTDVSATPTATVLPSVEPTSTPAGTPTPVATATAIQTAVATHTATNTPSATSTATIVATRTPTPAPTATPVATAGRTYYISPSGNDSAAGTLSAPWATFNRAWQALYPGDTLVLMDGIYYQQMRPNKRNGEPGRPITIKAQHDGKAIIDGQGQTPVQLGDTWPGPVGGDWYVVEGLVARNGGETVWSIRGENTILRRISGYNADPNGNSAIIWPYYSKNILIEDCIAAGTGRKTIIVFSSEDVTIRRCYSDWARWDGLTFCGVPWPGGNGPHIYNGHRIRFENVISVGPVPDRSIAITNQSDTATVTGVEVLGSIAVGAGRTVDGKPYPYAFPGAGICGNDAQYQFYPGENAGFVVYGQGPIIAPVFRDVLATNNAREGFGIIRPYGTGGQDVILDHATLYGNGINLLPDGELTVTNSKIAGTSYQGEGARLTHRYVDGVLTSEPLWPWPMDARAQAELGINVTEWARPYVSGDNKVLSD